MRNYVSCNTKYFKGNQISKITNHNERLSDIDYLLPNEHHQFKNTNHVFSDGGSVVLDEGQGLGGIGTYADNLKKMKATQSSFIQKRFYDLQDRKTKALGKYYNYKPNENENAIIETVVSLSEEQALHYLKKGVSFDEAIKDYMLEIKKIYGLEVIGFQRHTDEGWIDRTGKAHYNIHYHCQFFNMDFSKDKTVLRNLRRKDWEDMQDIAQASFQKHNLDFIRGESKELTGKEHLERFEYIITKKLEELNALSALIQTEQKQFETLQHKVTKNSNMYKLISTNLKNLQNKQSETQKAHDKISKLLEEKKLEVQIVEESIENHNKWLEETKKGIKTFLKEHLTKNKESKYEINNMQNFYEEIVDLAIYLTNYDIKIKALEEAKATNAILREKIKQLQNTFSLDAKQKDELDLKIEKLIVIKDDLEEENYWYKKFIEHQNQQEEYNSFMQEQNKERKLEEIEM